MTAPDLLTDAAFSALNDLLALAANLQLTDRQGGQCVKVANILGRILAHLSPPARWKLLELIAMLSILQGDILHRETQ